MQLTSGTSPRSTYSRTRPVASTRRVNKTICAHARFCVPDLFPGTAQTLMSDDDKPKKPRNSGTRGEDWRTFKRSYLTHCRGKFSRDDRFAWHSA